MRGPHDGARCDAAQLGPAAVLHDGPDMSDGPRAAPGVVRWAAAFNPADSDPYWPRRSEVSRPNA